MKRIILVAAAASGALAFVQHPADAMTCARGVYRAGCAGPNGAAVVRRPPYAAYPHAYYAPRPYYRPRAGVSCASGPYRAGCAGPNGAAVVRRPY